MNAIIFEGPDGGGKSTLIDHLTSRVTVDSVTRSEGPEKYDGEINDRVVRYHSLMAQEGVMTPMVFDRHPCISQPIYGIIHNQNPPKQKLIDELYRMKPLMIYCRPMGAVTHTAEKEWDTPEFLANVDRNYHLLVEAYDRWALEHATLTYRIGDDMDMVVRFIKAWEEAQ
jgi:predicted ATPase